MERARHVGSEGEAFLDSSRRRVPKRRRSPKQGTPRLRTDSRPAVRKKRGIGMATMGSSSSLSRQLATARSQAGVPSSSAFERAINRLGWMDG